MTLSLHRFASAVLRGTLATIAAVLFAASLSAESVSVQMQVSVRVEARAIATMAVAPDAVIVTSEDIARGFVDAPAPVVIQGRTNSRRGYRLQVSNTSSAFSSMQLVFGESAMNISGEGWIARPYTPAGESVSLRVRLHLAPGVTPGRYALPLTVSASAL